MRLFTLLLLFWTWGAIAQPTRIYDWYSLQCQRSGLDVTQSDNFIIYSTGIGLLFFDKADPGHFEMMTTIEGLSESSIQRIIYNREGNLIFVVYASGSIDLIDGDRQVTTLQDIKNNNTLVPDKTVHNLVSVGSSIFVCMPFGLVEFNAVDRTFVNTVQVEGGVYAVTEVGDRLFLTGSTKLYTIDRKQQPNISYIGNWSLMPQPNPQADDQVRYGGVTWFNNQLYTTYDRWIYRINDDLSYSKIDTLPSINQVAYLEGGPNYMMIGGSCNPGSVGNPGCIGEVVVYDGAMQRIEYDRQFMNDHNKSIESNGWIWMADNYHGFRYVDMVSKTMHLISLDHLFPWSNNVVGMIKTPTSFYVAPGGYNNVYDGRGIKEGLFEFRNQMWTIHNQYSDPFFGTPHVLADFSSFAFHEASGELAIGSYSEGIVTIGPDGEKKLYNTTNSAIQHPDGDVVEPRIGDLKYDADGNLWVTNVLSNQPVVVFTPDKSSYRFDNNFGARVLVKLAIDPINGYKWMVEPGRGIVVYDSGANLTSAADDRWKIVPVYSTFENQNIQPRAVYCDANGRVWIGTLSGVFVIDCGSAVFDDDYVCETRFPYIQDGNALGAFLYGQTVNVITEDGAGRKWFGTNTGIYVTNSGVDEVVLNLTPENSPLASANVTAIEIEKTTGDVYIGTNAGIQVYRTDATSGNLVHDSQLKIYPNPVRPDYGGPIIIQGLAGNSSVKITDVNGKLVYETQSQGGQAIWYGKDLSGGRVASGVYYVLATTTHIVENPIGITGKIIFLK